MSFWTMCWGTSWLISRVPKVCRNWWGVTLTWLPCSSVRLRRVSHWPNAWRKPPAVSDLVPSMFENRPGNSLLAVPAENLASTSARCWRTRPASSSSIGT